MLDFNNAKPNAEPVETNAKALKQSQPEVINYDNATDAGLNEAERADTAATAAQANVGKLTSLTSGFKASILGGAIQHLSSPDFEPDPSFDARFAMTEDTRVKALRPDADEMTYLAGANSNDDYNYRLNQIPKTRQDMSEAAANPITGGIGMLAPDLPAMLVPGLGEAALGRTAGTALRIAADAYDIGSSVIASDQLGQSSVVNGLVAGTGILDLDHLLSRRFGRIGLRNTEKPVAAAADDVAKASAYDGTTGAAHTDLEPANAAHQTDTGVIPPKAVVEPEVAPYSGKGDDLIVDPDQPVMPQSTRDIDGDLAQNAETPVREVQATEYSVLNEKTVNSNLAYEGKLNTQVKGKPILSDIPMRPAMARAIDRLDELSAAGKLPDDFPPQYRTLMNAVADNAADVPIHFDRKSNFRPHYGYNPVDLSGSHLRLAFPKEAIGKGRLTASELIGSMHAGDLRDFLHESIHAATSRAIMNVERGATTDAGAINAIADMNNLRAHLTRRFKAEVADGTLDAHAEHYIGYYLKNNHELIAGLGDAKGGYVQFLQRQTSPNGKESALRRLGKAMLRVLGVRSEEATGLTALADAMEDLLAAGSTGGGKLGKQALSEAAPTFMSDSMQSLTSAGRKAALEAPAGRARGAAALAMAKEFKQRFNQFFALRDEIARTGDPLRAAFADRLVADATKVGERSESVADLKRLMKSETDALTAHVEKAVQDTLAKSGVNRVDQLFYRRKFVQARTALEEKVAHYLDYAHGEYRKGNPVNPPDDSIKGIVDAYTGSGWAERWFEHMQASGINAEGQFEKSPYYFPRRYSGNKVTRLMQQQGYQQKDFVDAFSDAMRDTYPAMDRDLSRQVARTWFQGLTSAQPNTGAMWRRAINGMSNDEFLDMLVENGVSRADADAILEKSVFAKERTGSNPDRNLRKRNELDMQKEYTTSSGRVIKLADLMDTDVTKVMNQYNNRMSGRAAFSAKGYIDLKDLAKEIDDLKLGLTEDAQGWTNKVNDTIDALMGYPVHGDTPDWLLASGYLSNAMMLKNSGLYQLTDLGITTKEFGMYRVVRSMMQSGLFKHVEVELGRDATLHGRLTNVLNGSIQNDLRFRWLHTLAEDNTDLTRSSLWVNRMRNLSQSAYSVNGMRLVHRAMVNMNSGLIRDSILAALGGSEKDAKLLQRFGLRRDLLEQMRTAHKVNPDATFSQELQTHLEAVGQRFMDYVVQQNRTGETSHFAEMNPIGRVLIGYQSFAMAGTNKLLRRHIDNNDWMGLAILMSYQFPLMALATYAKYGLDGKLDDKTTKDMVIDAVSGMSAIGGASLIADLFTQNRGGGVSMLGGASSVINTLQSISKKDGPMTIQDVSKLVPLAQEFVPLRALINNTAD